MPKPRNANRAPRGSLRLRRPTDSLRGNANAVVTAKTVVRTVTDIRPTAIPQRMNRPSRISLSLPILAAFAIICGCVSRGSESGFSSIPPEGWAYGDTLSFTVSRADSLTPATLSVAVRNNNDYPYSNLWLEVSYNDGRSNRCDTVNIRLADVYGRWTGKGFGPEYQSEAIVAKNLTPPNGSLINVRHIMRTDTLTGIEHAGITLSAQSK